MPGFWKVKKDVANDMNCILSAAIFADFCEKEAILRAKKALEDEFFYFNAEDIEHKFFISRYTRRKIIKALVDKKYLELRKGSSFLNRTYYKVTYREVEIAPRLGQNCPTSEVKSVLTSKVKSDLTYKETSKKKLIERKDSIVNMGLTEEWLRLKWNELGGPFQKHKKVGTKLSKLCESSLKVLTNKVEWEENFFLKIKESDFLISLAEGSNDDYQAKVTLAWCLGGEKFKKIVNGKYDNRKSLKKGGNLDLVTDVINEIYS